MTTTARRLVGVSAFVVCCGLLLIPEWWPALRATAVYFVCALTEDRVFIWGNEKLLAEGFVYRAFKGWFGGYQRYE